MRHYIIVDFTHLNITFRASSDFNISHFKHVRAPKKNYESTRNKNIAYIAYENFFFLNLYGYRVGEGRCIMLHLALCTRPIVISSDFAEISAYKVHIYLYQYMYIYEMCIHYQQLERENEDSLLGLSCFGHVTWSCVRMVVWDRRVGAEWYFARAIWAIYCLQIILIWGHLSMHQCRSMLHFQPNVL